MMHCASPSTRYPALASTGRWPSQRALKVQSGSAITSLTGDQSTIQTVVELVPASDYETAKNRMLDDSRSRAGRTSSGCWPGPTPS